MLVKGRAVDGRGDSCNRMRWAIHFVSLLTLFRVVLFEMDKRKQPLLTAHTHITRDFSYLCVLGQSQLLAHINCTTKAHSGWHLVVHNAHCHARSKHLACLRSSHITHNITHMCCTSSIF